LNDQRLPKRVFNYDIRMMNAIDNWSSYLVSLLQILQLNTYLEQFEQINFDVAKDRLMSVQLNNWNNMRSQKIKLRNYNLFKSDMAAEPYVILDMPKQIRSCYAQFRTGILPIMVEVGRFYGIPLEERFCTYCKEKQLEYIEDEFHILLICMLYQEQRNQLYAKVILSFPSFNNMDDLDRFLFLNSNFQVETAKYIYSAMKIRECLLYNVI